MMKIFKGTYYRFLRLKLMLIFMVFTFSCMNLSELKSPVDGIKILINYNIFKTFLSFRFVDSATGSLIGGTGSEKVTAQISGVSSPAIVDQLGNHKESYESVFGLLSLALNPKDPWKPSQQNTLSFQIGAASANYKPVSLNLQISESGKYEYRVMMEKTNVDASGIKTYFLPLNLNENGEVKDDFSYRSSGGEALIKLKKGTQFLKADGTVEKSTVVNLIFTAYTRRDVAPIPGSLLADVILKDKSVKTSAIDIYRVTDVQVINNSLESLTSFINNPVILRYKIDNNAYHPKTKTTILPDNDVQTYTYLPKSTAWQLDEALKVQSDSLGYYSESQINNVGLHATGMHINICSMDGQISFLLPGVFPVYPVPAGVYLYRKIDSRYIGGVGISIPEKGFLKPINFNVPENTPVRFYIWNNSNLNSFTAKPDNFVYDSGCGSFGTFETLVTSTSEIVSGKVKVNIGDGFSSEEFTIQANIFTSPNSGLLWSKQFKIGKTSNVFDILANLPTNTEVYLQIQAVDNANTFESVPGYFTFNTSIAKGLSLEYTINPLFIPVNFNFNFNRSPTLPNSDFMVKAVLTNMDTQNNEGEFIFQVKPGQTVYTSKMFLSKMKRYQLNLKRVSGALEFIAYPYEFVLGAITQKDYSYDCELSEVVLKSVNIKSKVICKQSEIIPTLHGYYRTVWEDDWKESDIVNGALTITCEMNATYIIGIIVNGEMKSTTYKVDGTNYDFNFNLNDEECSKMGW